MSSFGIICEFNPLHKGHKKIIDEARQRGAESVVCVMSGNAVQRGELAVFDKYVRAEAAILCGADLVLELPFPWSSASAEFFAKTGVKILSSLCDNIIFGSECGDIELLKNAAKAASSDEFRKEYRERLEAGEGAAFAYFDALKSRGYEGLSSNDLLGIEYIRAAIELGANIEFHTLKREGAAYNESELGEAEYPSATAIRNAWSYGNRETEKYIPEEANAVFERCFENGEFTDMWLLSRAILTYFRLSDATQFSGIADTDGGIANRICSLAKESADAESFFEALKTKRYTDAKLRRAILFCMTGVADSLLSSAPEYVTLLGASENGRALLSSLRKDMALNIVTKPADAPKESEQFKAGEKLESIFTLALAESKSLAEAYKKRAFIN